VYVSIKKIVLCYCMKLAISLQPEKYGLILKWVNPLIIKLT